MFEAQQNGQGHLRRGVGGHFKSHMPRARAAVLGGLGLILSASQDGGGFRV